MRTISYVHTPEERLAMRLKGERRVARSQWRLATCAVILRTAVTRILPQAGAAGWWMTLVCLLPGLALYGLCCAGMRISKTDTLPACAEKALGSAGVWLLHLLTAAALAAEGAACMTALATLFTEGIGTRGTQLTLGLSAAGLLLFALHSEGLPRGIFFLRIPVAAMAAAALGGLLALAKTDHLFPVLGDGVTGLQSAFLSGVGMGWIFILPLMQPPADKKRTAEPWPPVVLCMGVIACLNLALPQELLSANVSLGDSLTGSVAHLAPFPRLMGICLWLALLFLSMASMASLAGRYILVPAGRTCSWLPGMIALCWAAAQGANVRWMWQTMCSVQPWLLAVLGTGAALAWLGCGRRRR